MRHGYAGEAKPDPTAERARPLKPVGVDEVTAIALEMQNNKEFPKVIYASPLVRALQTADIVGKILSVSVQSLDDLGPNMPLKRLITAFARDDQSSRVMLVGHHDNFEPMIEALGGGKSSDLFVTAEVRRYRLDRDNETLDERWRCTPSDVGMTNYLGYTGS
jgi:phosphohistidine phosphatase SixA